MPEKRSPTKRQLAYRAFVKKHALKGEGHTQKEVQDQMKKIGKMWKKEKGLPSPKAAKKRSPGAAKRKQLRKETGLIRCRSPKMKFVNAEGKAKCYKPCSPTKSGTPRFRSPKDLQCRSVKHFAKASPASKKSAKAQARKIMKGFKMSL